jgi:threonine/homoserine/homoserine lactone efflux protein
MTASLPPTTSGALLALAAFAFVMSITPGPNNLMLLASGARFGLRRTLPHILGITGGFAALLVVAWAGAAALLLQWPAALRILTILSAAYLLWLGWALLRAAPPSSAAVDAGARPMSLLEAAAFQFVNPKGWSMAVAAVAITADAGLAPALALLALVAVGSAINLPCVLVWAVFGASLRRALERRWAYRAFALGMAATIVATALWMLAPLFRANGFAGAAH